MENNNIGCQRIAGMDVGMRVAAPERVSCVAGTPSRAIVDALMAANPNIKRLGFAKAVRALFEWDEIGGIARTMIPDAYHISPERREVTIIEVDDTHPIDALKASKIGDLADAMLEDDWTLVVLVLDYAGSVRAAVPGWCFLPAYTARHAPSGCRDFTPAAVAVARAATSGPVADADELADRL